jgi:hypothetical protein
MPYWHLLLVVSDSSHRLGLFWPLGVGHVVNYNKLDVI